jgi:hypothetical protein
MRQAAEEFGLTYFVVDGMEWQTYLWPEDEAFLRVECEVVGTFRDLTVYRRGGERGDGRGKRGYKGKEGRERNVKSSSPRIDCSLSPFLLDTWVVGRNEAFRKG